MKVKCYKFMLTAPDFVYKERGPLLNLQYEKYQEGTILPYLLHGTPESDVMKIIGKGSKYVTIDPLYVPALLCPSQSSSSSTLPEKDLLKVAPYNCLREGCG